MCAKSSSKCKHFAGIQKLVWDNIFLWRRTFHESERTSSRRAFEPVCEPGAISNIRMGGPCFLTKSDGSSVRAPACTDNFQIRPFIFEGVTFHSCEQAYQANKFPKDGNYFNLIATLGPQPGQSGHDHGMDCWSLGQRGERRQDWDRVKVGIMLAVNRAKYQAHEVNPEKVAF